MRFQLVTLFCVLTASNALAISETNKPQEKAERHESKDIFHPHLEIRTSITTKAGAVSAGASVIASLFALAGYLASQIHIQSDLKSCSVISGSADGANWQFQATTSGANCDTTSETKTIEDAVQNQLQWMQTNRYDVACFTMKHGSGTWTGNLRISLDGKAIASNQQCASVQYVQI